MRVRRNTPRPADIQPAPAIPSDVDVNLDGVEFSGTLQIRCEPEIYAWFREFADDYATSEAALVELLRLAHQRPDLLGRGRQRTRD